MNNELNFKTIHLVSGSKVPNFLALKPAASSPSTLVTPSGGGYLPWHYSKSARFKPAETTLINSSSSLAYGISISLKLNYGVGPSYTTKCLFLNKD